MRASIVTSRPARRLSGFLPAAALAVLISLVLPATSFAQATRTWVSGVGDDANPCSRTAPCKTWAGAISKTAAGGEIDALDPGGFGAVTITKAITLDGGGFLASTLVSGTNGIVIQAGASDRVTLRNIRINGVGTGLNGVRFLAGARLRLENDIIFSFTQNGVDFSSTTANARLDVDNTTIENVSQNGINFAAGAANQRLGIDNSTIEGAGANGVLATDTASGSPSRTTLNNDNIEGNNCGLSAGGPCGTNPGTGVPVLILAYNSGINDNNNAGVFAAGTTGTAVIGGDVITGNANGLLGNGLIYSFGNNENGANGVNGTPTTTVSRSAQDVWNRVVAKAKALARKKHHRHRRATHLNQRAVALRR